MNKYLIVLSIVFFAACSSSDEFDGFIIEGDISGYNKDSSKVVLRNESADFPIIFTEDVKDGKFVIRGKLDTPEMYILTLTGINDTIRLFVDNSLITISGIAEDLSGALITGAQTNELATEHEEELENLSINSKIDELLEKYNSIDISQNEKREIENKILAFNLKIYNIDSLFLEKHPKSYYSLYLLAKKADNFSTNFKEQKIALFRSIPEFSSNRFLRLLEESVNETRELRKGGQCPDFKLNDTSGHSIRFSDIYSKNKITMLYFWASWCDACPKFNAYSKSLFQTFGWRGLGVVGISLDENKKEMELAINKAGISWTVLSDYKGWKSSLAAKFQIKEIPSLLLVDSTGKIISYKPPQKNLKQLLRENLLSEEELDLYYKTYSDTLNNKRVP